MTGQSRWEFFFPENNDVFSNLTDDMLLDPPDFFTNDGHIGVQYTIKIWTHNSYPLGRKTKNNFFPPMASKEIWSKSEVQMLKDAIANISNRNLKPDTSDYMYWISTRIYQSRLQIEGR